MRKGAIMLVLVSCPVGWQTQPQPVDQPLHTFCNPVNLSYRFCLDEPSRREAADPTIVWYRDRYFLFASKSGGYWHSTDLLEWKFIETDEIPVEEYAPTAIALDDTLYFLASSARQSTIYKSGDPLGGNWNVALEKLEIPVWDPAFYLDDDDRLYLYWGCSNANPIYGVELNYQENFAFIGERKELIHANPVDYGWEVPGDYNTLLDQRPWIEGAWMNKYNGKYYLQYSGPGTEFKSYADGVYTSDNPLGPYQLQPLNPFAYKPEGFAAGAGHGNTFTDQYGNYWHIGTITISQKHMFERRLGLYPVFFDEQGSLYSITKYGDYPFIMPQTKISGFEDIFPGWMLLSYGCDIEVSSSIDSLPPSYIVDEDIRSYWAAESGDPGEYVILDLKQISDVHAIQINFAEHHAGITGRAKNLFHRYLVEQSNDASNWTILVDKSKNNTDNSHPYIQLADKVSCRYLRLTNIEVPGGHFALSGFRVFGKGNGMAPEKVSNLDVTRDPNNRRSVALTWARSGNATGYNISYGVDQDRLYQNYMVYLDTEVVINTLNGDRAYYFSIESFNENGITESGVILEVE
jgi:xylan 1,4-beta-xylosidase